MEGIQFPAALEGSAWKRRAKVMLGRTISILAPRVAEKVAEGALPPRLGRVERLVIAALVDRHRRAGTLDKLAPLHAWLWRGKQAVVFHAQARARFDSWWLAQHSEIVAPIRQLIAAEQSPYRRLCEIGCGSGLILEDLSHRLPELDLLVGLDLSADQTELNRRRKVDPRIRFDAGDAITWVPANGQAGTIYLTVAGVFEYFSRSALQTLFGSVARSHRPAVIAIVEPIPPDFDLENEWASRPYGYENSLGHNYLHLFRDAGFAIRFQQRQQVSGQCFLLVVAEACK